MKLFNAEQRRELLKLTNEDLRSPALHWTDNDCEAIKQIQTWDEIATANMDLAAAFWRDRELTQQQAGAAHRLLRQRAREIYERRRGQP